MTEYVSKTTLEKRILELEESALELYCLVHDSDLIQNKIMANDLYDVTIHKSIESTDLIPEIKKSFEAGQKYGEDNACNAEVDLHSSKEEYISNLKIDIC